MPPTPWPPLLEAALDCAARGWPVFPLRRGSKRPTGHPAANCPHTGRCSNGHLTPEQRATTDPELITRAWSAVPYGIGLATGPAGLVVIDLDKPKTNRKKDAPCGATTFRALCERTGQPAPATRTVRTAGGGTHLYFTAPPGTHLRNTAGTLGPLVDTRAWGGYVVAPGTELPAGRYELANDCPVAALPAWLQNLLTPPPAAVPAGPLLAPAVSGSAAAKAALAAECGAVQRAPDKQRNTVLNRAAFKIGRFIAWGDITRHEVEDAFQAAGTVRGLTAAECRATIRSALDSSIRKARPRQAA